MYLLAWITQLIWLVNNNVCLLIKKDVANVLLIVDGSMHLQDYADEKQLQI